jgi:hypothetical protein
MGGGQNSPMKFRGGRNNEDTKFTGTELEDGCLQSWSLETGLFCNPALLDHARGIVKSTFDMFQGKRFET